MTSGGWVRGTATGDARVAPRAALSPVAAIALIVVVSKIMGAPLVSAGVWDEQQSASELLVNYRMAIRTLQARYQNAQIDGSSRGRTLFLKAPPGSKAAKRTSEPPPTGSNPFWYAYSDDSEKLRVVLRQPRFNEHVFIRTGPRFSNLARASDKDPYYLTDSGQQERDPSSVQTYRERVRDAPFSLGGLANFPEYVASPDFQVIGVDRRGAAGNAVTKIRFRYAPKVDRTSPNLERRSTLDGWMALDPAAGWVIRDYEYTRTITRPDGTESVAQRTGSIQYANANGTPVPADITYKEVIEAAGQVIEMAYHIDHYQLGAAPPEEFTLAAFGLGDFDRTAPRSSRWGALSLFTVGIAALLVAGALARFAARRGRGRLGGTDAAVS
jgi:hypothetical protein